MNIRAFRTGDEPQLERVFYSAVHHLAAKNYSPEQLDAWAPANPDMERWIERMRMLKPFVAEEEGLILGYADLQSDGQIDHFYVSGMHARQGVGSLLMDAVHKRAQKLGLERLYADVSHAARPFFQHFGFQTVEERRVVVAEVSMSNTRMKKWLTKDR